MAKDYWRHVLSGAWDKTHRPLGWDRKKAAVALLAVGTIIAAGIHFGFAAMLTTATGYLWIAAPATFAAFVLFVWGVIDTQAKLYRELDEWSSQQIDNRDSKLAKFTNAKPNYTAVRLQHQYSIGHASRLWVGRDPNLKGTPESQAWYDTFVSAIQKGELDFEPSHPRDNTLIRYEQKNPNFNTMISRDEFKRYARSINQDPPFLRDD